MVSFEMNDMKKIGIGLTGFGVFFSFLGIIFFFDKGLIAMGNILFLSGLGLTIGPKSTLQFFAKPKNYKGTISFGAGFFLVLIGWPFFGMILEAYGFIVLFRSWILANACCFLAKDSYHWLDISATVCYISMNSLTVTGEKEFQCNLLFSHSDVETRRLLITTECDMPASISAVSLLAAIVADCAGLGLFSVNYHCLPF
ncbi:hypothetical protein EJB05_22317 [Eragrostis curvula]|uniref:Vesicle transport protein n=1 Tax=Eragrostis curvula TaxID=38414 RepID=A0A5J9V3Z3_9POAL|nr:hypothetical protein EJB05_22317 [Eragrostis curvula]